MATGRIDKPSRGTDWAWVRSAGERRRQRLATLRPDEEPDDDMMSWNDLCAKRALGEEE